MLEKPHACEVCFDSIPEVLRKIPAWVCWSYRFDTKTQRYTKVLINPRYINSFASTTDPSTWNTFDFVRKEASNYDGIGFVFAKEWGIVGIDLDKCIDANGVIDAEAEAILKTFNTYSELSPSGKGVHIFALGTLPDKGRKHGNREIYGTARYFTVTGRKIPGCEKIEHRQAEIDSFYASFPTANEHVKKESDPGESVLDDDEVLIRARSNPRFLDLWNGNWKQCGYPSQSEADLALCSILSYWCKGDREQVDRLFRRSGLMRDKWEDHPYYQDRTLDLATESGNYYQSPADYDAEAFAEAIKFERSERKEIGYMRRLLTFDELSALPEPKWLIDDIIEEQTLCCLWGPSNIGKSFHALDMSLCVASGKAYHKKKVEQGNVVYLLSEGSAAKFKDRVKSWCHHHKLPVPTAWRAIIGSYNLVDQNELNTFTTELKKHNPKLLVIDTLAYNFLGDEDRKNEIQPFINIMQTMCSCLGITVLLIHHPGKDATRGERGSYALRCALNTSIEVEGTGWAGEQVTTARLKCHKQRNGDFFSSLNLKREKVLNSLVWTYEGTNQDIYRNEHATLFEAICNELAKAPASASDLYETERKVGGKGQVEDAMKFLKEHGVIEYDGKLKKNKLVEGWETILPVVMAN